MRHKHVADAVSSLNPTAEQLNWFSITAVYMDSLDETEFSGQVSYRADSPIDDTPEAKYLSTLSITLIHMAKSTCPYRYQALDQILSLKDWLASGLA